MAVAGIVVEVRIRLRGQAGRTSKDAAFFLADAVVAFGTNDERGARVRSFAASGYGVGSREGITEEGIEGWIWSY